MILIARMEEKVCWTGSKFGLVEAMERSELEIARWAT